VAKKFLEKFDAYVPITHFQWSIVQVPKQVPKEECKNVPKQIPKQECRNVPRQECKNVPKQVPKEECKNVPRQVLFPISESL
jgi:hypothetical protein